MAKAWGMVVSDEWEPPAKAVDIGSDHRIVFAEYHGERAGVTVYHRKPDGSWCCGWVSFNGSAWGNEFPGKPGWDVTQREPLTLAPSILCRACWRSRLHREWPVAQGVSFHGRLELVRRRAERPLSPLH